MDPCNLPWGPANGQRFSTKTKITIEIVDAVLIYTKGVDNMDQCDATRTAN